jgi:hypothetical protein
VVLDDAGQEALELAALGLRERLSSRAQVTANIVGHFVRLARGVRSRAGGKSASMTESGQGGDPAAKLERTADELEHNLDRLDDHISDAQKAAQARREEAMPAEEVAGDWEETRGAPGQGEDPEGAIGEHGDGEGATERDATDGEGDSDAATASGDDAPSAAGDDGPTQRDDPVGSRMPGHPSGGDD